MPNPLLSVYFIVRAYIKQPNGDRRHCEEQIHKVCTRKELESRSYLNYVAWGLYVDLKYTANEVEQVHVLWADAPGSERVILNAVFLPGDLDPEWRAA